MHRHTDALSHLPCHQCGHPDHDKSLTAEVAVAVLQLPVSHKTVREMQLANPLIGLLLLGKESTRK